ncbi:MAG: universal stress protein [Hyphomonadaceae bacterium]
MAIKDVFAPVFDEPGDAALLEALETLEIVRNAHVAVTLVAPLPEPVTAGDGMTAVLGDVINMVHAQAAKARAKIDVQAKRNAWEARTIETWSHAAIAAAVTAARHSDLSIIAAPGRERASARVDVLEGLLMDSGRPVLAIPAKAKLEARFARIFLAWDASREAAHALAGAHAFLEGADDIIVGTVDAQPRAGGVGEAPGADIAAHLARHGYRVDVRNFDGLGRNAGEALLAAAEDSCCDLVVMGAYHHARLQQALFGGATRTMLEDAAIPLLLAH